VLIGRVVDDEVHDQPHAAAMDLGDESIEIGEIAEYRIDGAIVTDVVAVVVLGRCVDRREPDDVNTQTGDVV
jgi:hypothetical protein